MDISLRVNRISTHAVELPVTFNGDVVHAMVPELEVELHDESGVHGSLTLHFRSKADIAEAKAAFGEGGGMVTLHVDPAMPKVSTDVSTEHPTETEPDA